MQKIGNTNRASCKVVISELELLVYLGCRAREKQRKQIVSITIEMYFKNAPIGANTGRLKDTICYSDLAKHIQNFVENKYYNLVERFSNEIYECVSDFLIKQGYSEVLAKVTVNKILSGGLIKGGVLCVYGEDIL